MPKSTHGNASKGGESYPVMSKNSHRHKAIMEYMILHPQARGREIAEHFEISLSWFYIVTNTDLFKAKFVAMRDEITSVAIADIQERLSGIALQGLDLIAENLETSADPLYIRQTTEMVLKAQGYGSKTPSVTVKVGEGSLVQVVSSSVIANAEARRIELTTPTLPAIESTCTEGESSASDT